MGVAFLMPENKRGPPVRCRGPPCQYRKKDIFRRASTLWNCGACPKHPTSFMLTHKEVKRVRVKLAGKKVKLLRISKKITQEDLAEQAEATDRYIRDLESGRKSNPSAALLFRMSKILGVSMEELIEISIDAPDGKAL